MEDLASLVVEFTANIDAVTSAGSGVVAVIEHVATSAAESASAITESMTGATEGFTALTEAATTAGVDIGDGMLVAYDQIGQIGTASEEAASTLGDAMAQANASMSETGAAASSASAAVSTIFSSADTAPIVTAVDIAQANLTILEGKAQQARDKLQMLQNSANAGEAVTGIDTAAAQLTLLEAKVQEARDTLQGLGTQAEETGQEVEDGMSQASEGPKLFSGGLGGMINSVGMTIFSLQNMINVGQQVASGLLGPAMAAEQVKASFTNLLGSSTLAANELDQLNTFAAKTQFKTADIDLAASTLIGFGFQAKAVVPDLTSIGDALTAVGRGTPAEMQSVVDIFGKMQVQGKLTQGDITELGKHGINAMQLIALGSGLSTTQLQEMVKKGAFPAKDAIDALTKGIEKNPIYAGGMAKQSGTLSGLLSTLQSDWSILMAKFMTPVLPQLEKWFTELTNTLSSPQFQDFATMVGTNIVNAVTTLATDIGNLVATGQNIVQFFQQNQTAANGLIAILITTAGIITGLLVAAFIEWAAAMLPVMIETLATAAPFILLGVIVAAVVFGIIEAVQNWGAISKWLQNVWNGIPGFFQGLWNDVLGFFQKYGLDILEVILGPVGLIMHFWQPITQFFSGLGQTIVSTFLNISLQIGEHILQAYRTVTGIFVGLGDWFHDHVWQPVVDKFTAVFTGLKNGAAGIWNSITGGFRTAFDDLIGFVNSAIDRINGVTGKVGIPAIPHIPLLALGGVVPPGGAAIAGETGKPELVLGGMSGATVVGVSQTASLMAAGSQMALAGSGGGIGGSGSGQVTVTIPLNINGREFARATVDDLGAALMGQIRSSANPRGGLA